MKKNILGKNHAEAEGHSFYGDPTVRYYHRMSSEKEVENDKPENLPTVTTLLLGFSFVGVWMSLHALSYFTGQSYLYHVYELGLIPSDPEYYQYFTSIFIHGGFAHLLINLLAFISFGGLLHRHLGSHVKYLAFFVVTGSLTLYAQVLAFSVAGIAMNVPIVGASGAICAMFGYYGFAKPNKPVELFFILRVKAKNALALFTLLSLFVIGYYGLGAGGFAHTAHFVGLAAGMITAFRLGETPDELPIIDSDPLGPVKHLVHWGSKLVYKLYNLVGWAFRKSGLT